MSPIVFLLLSGSHVMLLRLSTPHYIIETDLGAKQAKRIARNMEAIRAEYIRRLSWLKGTITGKFRVVVYKERDDYISALGEEFANTSGVFISKRRLLASFIEGRSFPDLLATLYHEGFHQFIFFYIKRGVPIWVNEGLAQYFQHSTWLGKRFVVGQAPPYRVNYAKRMIRNAEFIPLSEFFTISDEQWRRNLITSKELGAKQYTQAWSIVHFLIKAKKGRYQKLLVTYLKELDKGTSPERAFKIAFGENLSRFQQAWTNYVLKELKPSSKYACLENLRTIAFILSRSEGATEAKDPTVLMKKLLRAKSWYVRSGDRFISPHSPDSVRELFSCPTRPQDGEASRSSYLFVKVKDSTFPSVVCPHHRAVLLIARLVLDPDSGQYTIETEEKPKPSRR